MHTHTHIHRTHTPKKKTNTNTNIAKHENFYIRNSSHKTKKQAKEEAKAVEKKSVKNKKTTDNDNNNNNNSNKNYNSDENSETDDQLELDAHISRIPTDHHKSARKKANEYNDRIQAHSRLLKAFRYVGLSRVAAAIQIWTHPSLILDYNRIRMVEVKKIKMGFFFWLCEIGCDFFFLRFFWLSLFF